MKKHEKIITAIFGVLGGAFVLYIALLIMFSQNFECGAFCETLGLGPGINESDFTIEFETEQGIPAGEYTVTKVFGGFNIELRDENNNTKAKINKVKVDKEIPPEIYFRLGYVRDDPRITTEVFAVKDIGKFNDAEVKLKKKDKVDAIFKCSDFDFDAFSCSSWDKVDIPFTEESGNIKINVESFSAYAGGVIDILNVQSYPMVGGTWDVYFTTVGTYDLTIEAFNGTTWSNWNENNDLKFLNVVCGDTVKNYQWTQGKVFISDYNCSEIAYETSKVLTDGKHHLKFTFGNITKYAHNDASNDPPVLTNATISTLTSYNSTKDNITLVTQGYDPNYQDIKNITNWFVNNNPIAILNLPFEGFQGEHYYGLDAENFTGKGGEQYPGDGGKHLKGEGGESLEGEGGFHFADEGNTHYSPADGLDHYPVSDVDQVLHMRFEGDADDSTSNNKDGTVTGATLASGQVGQAYEFDGKDDYIAVDGTGTLDMSNSDISFSAWVNLKGNSDNPSYPTANSIFEKGRSILSGGSATQGWALGMYGLSLRWEYGNGIEGSNVIHSFSSRPIDEWHHIVVIRDNSECNNSIYVDGELKNSEIEICGDIERGSDMRIGYSGYGDWNGTIDEVMVFNKALSSDEVKEIYNTQRKDIMGHWKFEGNADDSSSNNNDGIPLNSPVLTEGMVDQAYDFDGVDQLINITNADETIIIDGSEFSMFYWINPDFDLDQVADGASNDKVVIRKVGFVYKLDTTNDAQQFATWDRTSGSVLNANCFGTNTNWNSDTWYHLGVVRNSTGYQFYINGQSDGFCSDPDTAINDEGNVGIGGDIYSYNQYVDGTIDEVIMFNRSLSPSEVENLYDRQRKDAVAHFKLDGDATDSSANGNDGAVTGATRTTDAVVGEAYSFDGSNDYITIGDDDSLKFTTEASVSVWFKANTPQDTSVDPIFSSQDGTITTGQQFYLDVYAGNVRYMAGNNNQVSYPADWSNEWNHVVITKASGETGKLYFNGELVSQTATTNDFIDNSEDIYIGRRFPYSIRYFNGTIDEVIVFNRTLSSAEVEDIYNSQKPSFAANYQFEGNAFDSSSNSNDGTVSGAVLTDEGIIGQAYEFDGDNDYIAVSSPDLDFTSEDFTLSHWVYVDSLGDSGVASLYKGSWNNQGYYVELETNGQVKFYTNQNGAYQTTQSVSGLVTTGEWIHLLIVRDGSEAKIYKNGDEVSYSLQQTHINPDSSDSNFTIGIYGDNILSNDFDGRIDEVRIYERALTEDEIKDLYDSQKPSLAGYWKFDNNAFDSTDNNHGITSGALTTTDSVVGEAYSFDGVDDYISVPDDSSIDFGNGMDLSFSLWFYADSSQEAGASKRILCKRTDDNNGYVVTFSGGNLLTTFRKGGGYYRAGSTGVTTGVWHHFASTFDNSTDTFKSYLDGSEVTSTTGATDMGSGTDLFIGTNGDSTTYFKGKIDEVMIFNRTLSSSELEDIYESQKPALSAYYKFEGDASDSAGSNDGTVSGASLTDGIIGQAYSFDGDDKIEFSGSSAFNISDVSESPFTWSSWIWIANSPSDSQAVMSIGTADYQAFSFNINDNETLFIVGDTNGFSGWELLKYSAETILLNQWNHIALTRTNTGVYNMYINGADAGGSFTSTLDLYTNNLIFNVGGHYRGASGYSFNGIIDEVMIFNRSLYPKEILNIYNKQKPALEVFYEFEGNLSDSTGNNDEGTFKGDANITSQGINGKGLALDGVGDYVDTGIPSNILQDDGNWTLSAWAYPNNAGSFGTADYVEERVFTIYKSVGSSGIALGFGDDDKLEAYYATGTTNELVGTTSVTKDWHHIAMTNDGRELKIYMDGNLENSVAAQPTNGFTDLDTIEIGSYNNGMLYNFNGALDEVQIYNRTLTGSDIQELYNKGASGDVIAYWQMEGDTADSSTYDNDAVNNGATVSTDCMVGSCYDFDGGTDNLVIPDSTNLVKSSEMSFFTWVNFDDVSTASSTQAYIASNARDCCGVYDGFDFRAVDSKLYLRIWNSGSGPYIVGTTNLSDHTWYHVGFTLDGSDTKLYLNGELENSGTTTTLGIPSSFNLSLGGMGAYPSSYNLNGELDEAMIFNKVLTPEEVQDLYDRQLSSDRISRDYSSNSFDGNVLGAEWNQTGGHDGFGAYSFDGNRDKIETLAAQESISTLSAWVKPEAVMTDRWIFSGSTGYKGWSLKYDSVFSDVIEFYIGDGSAYTYYEFDHNFIQDQWNHISLVIDYDNDMFYYYLNGDLNYSTSIISNPNLDDRYFAISNNHADNVAFRGMVDDVLVFNRVLSADQIKALANDELDVITASETQDGDVWFVDVTASDGDKQGDTLRSNNITIHSYAPNITSISLQATDNPSNTTNSNLTLSLTTADLDGDEIKNITTWYVNNNPIMPFNMPFEERSNPQHKPLTDQVAYWQFEESSTSNIVDETGENNGSCSSCPTKITNGVVGDAYDFDRSSSQYITIAEDDANFNFGTGDFTYTGWFSSNDPSQTMEMLGSNFGPNFPFGILIYVENSMIIGAARTSTNGWVGVSYPILADTWYHTALIRESGTVSFYINGKLKGQHGTTSDANYNAHENTYIGTHPRSDLVGGAYDWDGKIDEVAIYSRALSSSEIADIYEEQSSTLIGHSKDYSNSSNHGIVKGAVFTSTGGFDGRGAYEFDGNDVIQIPYSASLNLTSDNTASVSVWVNPDSGTWGQDGYVFSRNGCVDGGTFYMWFKNDNHDSVSVNLGPGERSGNSLFEIVDDKWTNLVVVYNGSHYLYYQDGQESSSPIANEGTIYSGSCPLKIGARNNGDTSNWARFFEGTIDDVQIYNRALSPEQISALYNNRTDLIVSQETLSGETWKACVTANAGGEESEEFCSNDVPISDACSIPGDVESEITQFDNGVDLRAKVKTNVYRSIADGNPYPYGGHYTYCYVIYDVETATSGIKNLTIENATGADDLGYSASDSETVREPASYEITAGDDVILRWTPDNKIQYGEQSSAFYFISPYPPGSGRNMTIVDDSDSQDVPGPDTEGPEPPGGGPDVIPEFSNLGIVLMIISVLAGLFFIRKRYK